MAPIKLAVVFEQTIDEGGGYQQSVNAALLTRKLSPDLVEPQFFTTRRENITSLSKHGINVVYIRLSRFPHFRRYLKKIIEQLKVMRNLFPSLCQDRFERLLRRRNIDLVYFLSPSGLARRLDRLNYLTTVWDLCHRDNPEFPEVRWSSEFQAREKNYVAILPRAIAVLVDSEQSRANAVRRYGIDPERVWVMPFEASKNTVIKDPEYFSNYIDIREKYKLSVPYVFYPAQFWAHKNHVYLLDGLKYLEDYYGMRVGAIFAGSDQGNLAYIEEYADKLLLRDRICFAGFVDDCEIPYLYRQSLALVMPTYFGPTNLPPLEAFHFGVPVLYSDISGMRDQVGNAALLMNLRDPSTMAAHLAKLATDNNSRERLIRAGRFQINTLSHVDRVKILETILNDFRWRRNCWK